MDNFIQSVAQQLSLDEGVVRKGIGQVFKYCQEQVPADHRVWFTKIPGAESLAEESQQSATDIKTKEPKSWIGLFIRFILWLLTSKFILDLVRSLVSPLLGEEKTVQFLDSLSHSTSLVNKLQDLGIEPEKVAPLCQRVVDYMRQYLGDEMVDELLPQIPALGPILGSNKKQD